MPLIANNKYYILKANGKYYDIYNPFLMCTLTIIPSQLDATVTLTAAGYTQIGNSITVRRGTTVNYTVSKEEYVTKTGSVVVKNNEFKNIELKREKYPVGTVIFESNTAGTYNIDIDVEQDYKIIMVGAGGGAAYSHFTLWTQSNNGGSGAKVEGTITIPVGIYELKVGLAGTNTWGDNDCAYRIGTAGEDTIAFGQRAGGGGPADARTCYAVSSGSVGAGGTYNVTESFTGENGIAGNNVGWIDGYGAGGTGNGAEPNNGYIKIIAQ